MKFELKTENEIYSKSFSNFFRAVFYFALIIIFCDVAIKLGIVSRHYQLYNYCRILSVEKSKSNFDKISSITDLKGKQRIWEFCRAFVQ